MTIPYEYTTIEQNMIAEHFNVLDSEDWNKNIFFQLKKRMRNYLINLNDKKCYYCKTKLKLGTSLIPIEHILDKSNNPRFTFEPKNLTISCQACNTNKGKTNTLHVHLNVNEEYPDCGESFNIVHAYFDTYSQHIDIESGVFFVALNEKGMKTIEICKLYRSKLTEEKFLDLQTEQLTLCSDFARATFDQSLSQQLEEEVLRILGDYDKARKLNELSQILGEGEVYNLIIRGFYGNKEILDCLQLVQVDELINYKNLICNTIIIQKIKHCTDSKRIRLQIKELVQFVQTGTLKSDEYIHEIKKIITITDDTTDLELGFLVTIPQKIITLISILSRANGKLKRLILAIERVTVLRLQGILDSILEEGEFTLQLRKILILKEILEIENVKDYNNIFKDIIIS
ncbi:hypothetical protein ACDZ28_27600 [Paenibacillus sp. RS8]|uniref:hypothetical protein n=1 Tax=Paenibacillus sp. RS8 TaxID=3242681 RepID=UPI0035BFB784